MILKNFYRMLAQCMVYSAAADATVINYGGTACYRYSTSDSQNYFRLLYNMSTPLTQYANCGVVFGDGVTPPAYEDYKLSGNIITTISCTAKATSEHVDGECVSRTVLYTITNTGSEDITISEVGIMTGIYGGSTGNKSYNYCMLEHTLLEEPITIEAGGVGQITYTVKFNLPTE